MALAVDSEMPTNTGQGAARNTTPFTSPVTFSFTNTAGTVLYLAAVLSVNSGGSTSWGTITYGGQAMTTVIDQTSANGSSRVGIFRLLNPPTGANTVSIGFSMTLDGVNNQCAWEAGCISFTGNDTTTPEVQSAGSNGSSTTASGSLSGVQSGNITIGLAGAGSSMSTQTQTLSWAANENNLSTLGNGRLSRSTSTGSVTHSFTISASDSWATALVEVAAPGSGVPLPPFSPHRMPLGV